MVSLKLAFMMVTNVFITFALKEGDDCKIANGIKGICKRRKSCSTPNSTRFNRTSVSLKLCGFTPDDIQLFCCLPTVDKAVEACSRYKKSVYRKTIPFISNGRAAERGEFPHMVALWYEGQTYSDDETPWSCGGSLISDRFVLTAAHCLVTSYGPPTKVRVGDSDLATSEDDNKETREYSVSTTIVHPLFNKNKSGYNDIALLKTNETVSFSYFVYPACISIDSRPSSYEFTIVGWGATKGNDRRGIGDKQPLRFATVESMTNSDCHQIYQNQSIIISSFLPRGILKTQLCAKAKHNEDSDTCKGDSGGPLQYLSGDIYYIVGIASLGKPCGGSDPGVYTRVARFAHWIDVFAWGP